MFFCDVSNDLHVHRGQKAAIDVFAVVTTSNLIFMPYQITSRFHNRYMFKYLYKQRCSTTRHEGALVERRYSTYSFLTSALDGGEWSASRPGRALPPGKGPPVLFGQEAGWIQSRSGGKILLLLPGIKPRSSGRPVRNQTLCKHPIRNFKHSLLCLDC
jgi:hypothetical protein